MASAIRTNGAAVTGIGTAYALNKLIALDVSNTGQTGLCAVLDRIAVYFTVSGAPSTLVGRLYWDAAGDFAATEELTFAISTGLTTAASYTGIVSKTSRLLPKSAKGTAAGTMYLSLKVGANTADVAIGSVEMWTRDDNTATG